MTPNEQILFAVITLFFSAALISIACALAMNGMGHTKRDSIMAGAAAWVILMGIGVPIIALFDFETGGQPLILPQPPAATQTTQHATGWETTAARPLVPEGATHALTIGISRH
ncbi:hypothetical protein ACWGOK_11905 [Streptomyces eurythermus]